MGGVKHDQDKSDIGLVLQDFPRAIEAIGYVAAHGEKKYSRSGWKTVENKYNRYKSAMLRHYIAYEKGEINDVSGEHHLAHVAWNALAILEIALLEGENRDV